MRYRSSTLDEVYLERTLAHSWRELRPGEFVVYNSSRQALTVVRGQSEAIHLTRNRLPITRASDVELDSDKVAHESNVAKARETIAWVKSMVKSGKMPKSAGDTMIASLNCSIKSEMIAINPPQVIELRPGELPPGQRPPGRSISTMRTAIGDRLAEETFARGLIADACAKAGRSDLARRIKAKEDRRQFSIDESVDFHGAIESPRPPDTSSERAAVRIATALLGS